MSASFFARPSFDLLLRGNDIDDTIEILAVNKNDGASPRRKSREVARLVLGDTLLKLTARSSRAVRTVGTLKNVKPGAHENASSFETAGHAGLLRTRLS
jgi:hypothetical protein